MRKVSQMRNLCKQLFPSDNIGQTMVRVLELLTENPQNEVYHRDLVQVLSKSRCFGHCGLLLGKICMLDYSI